MILPWLGYTLFRLRHWLPEASRTVYPLLGYKLWLSTSIDSVI